MARIAILLAERCHPKECQWECQAYCPPVRMGQECIVEGPLGQPVISETLCIGCGICVHKCPFDAIKILNTPEADESEIVHRYGYNGFRLYRLPLPPPTGITGLLGPNGTGKTTALRLLAGQEVPNLGDYAQPGSWERVLEHYRGTALRAHFERIARGELRVAVKPQYVDRLADEPTTVAGFVGDRPGARAAIEKVGLASKAGRLLGELSGGELQLVALARTLATDADLYLLDEPSSYLDIVHRLEVARLLRELGREHSVIVVEHDLALLDYLADQAHLLYGEAAAFGVITHPLPMRTAINTYLTGYLKDENVRFRTEPVRFVAHPPKPTARPTPLVRFPELTKEFPEFRLRTASGELAKGETVGIVGPNATGKTTFVRLLAGVEIPSSGTPPAGVTVSYKPQYLKATQRWSLRERSEALAGDPTTFDRALFDRELVPGLHLDEVLDVALPDLSGGELQRAAVALALARPATLYLLDEPSAYLDADERMAMARLVRRQVERQAVSALVVDHDVYFIDLACDALLVFHHADGDGTRGVGEGPFAMREGMNRLLRTVDVTFRRDAETLRPRINREGSVLDREQRAKGEYYYDVAA